MSDILLTPIENQSTRLAKIKRFLSKPPPHAAWLVLFAAAAPPMQLQEWVGPFTPELAHEVEGLLVAHAKEDDSTQLFTLSFVKDEGDGKTRVIGTTKLTYRSQQQESTSAEQVALGIDGTQQGQVVQMQRHVEAMTRAYLTAHAQNLHFAHQLVDSAMLHAERVDGRVERMEKRIAELEQRNTELAGTFSVTDGDDDESSEIQARLLALVEQFGPGIMQTIQVVAAKYMAGAPVPPPPKVG